MTAINFDSYNLVHEKLSYYVRCKDKLFIYAILALLTILTFSITEENLYSPIIGSFVIIIFFCKMVFYKIQYREIIFVFEGEL